MTHPRTDENQGHGNGTPKTTDRVPSPGNWIWRMGGVVILVLLLVFADIGSIVRLLMKVHFRPLVWAMILMLPVTLVKSLRWQVLLSVQDIRQEWKRTALITMASNFIANITPGRIGEAAKALYLREKQGVGFSRSVPTVVLDRIFDIYTLLLVSLTGLLFFSIGNPGIWTGILVTGGMASVLTVLMFSRYLGTMITGFLLRFRILRRYRRRIQQAVDSYFTAVRKMRCLRAFLCLPLTGIAYGLLFTVVYLLAESADLGINFWQSAVLLSVANILSFLPVSFSGIGTRDAALVFFFSRMGRSGEEAIVFSTLILLAVFLVSALYGFAAYMYYPLQWKNPKGPQEKNP